MKRFLSIMICAAMSMCAFAATPSGRLAAAIDKMQENCPFDIRKGWTIQAVSADNDGTNVTMIIDPVVADFPQHKLDSGEIKARLLRALSNISPDQEVVIRETVASGLPLIVDAITPSGDDTVSVTISPEQLSAK